MEKNQYFIGYNNDNDIIQFDLYLFIMVC